MVSIHENLARVRQGVAAYETARTPEDDIEDEHVRILREHEDAILEHERSMKEHKYSMHRHRRSERESSHSSLRFRFKDSHRGSKKRKRTADDGQRSRPKSPSRSEEKDGLNAYTAHPLARPPSSPPYLDPSISTSTSPQPGPAEQPAEQPQGADHAFRASLFDAIADDEGAAYWEGVYSQPIHIYTRPAVQTETGELEHMDDDEYAQYVKRKMWERKNPELVREMKMRDRQAKDKREEKRSDGRRAGKDRGVEGNEFMHDVDAALERGQQRKEAKRLQRAWAAYLEKWEQLKDVDKGQIEGRDLARSIPWPVDTGVATKMTRDEVERFFVNAPLADGETRTTLLKTERFRWHPDKIQHRFGGENVDAETLKMVTSVFQTVDELLVTERTRSEKA